MVQITKFPARCTKGFCKNPKSDFDIDRERFNPSISCTQERLESNFAKFKDFAKILAKQRGGLNSENRFREAALL